MMLDRRDNDMRVTELEKQTAEAWPLDHLAVIVDRNHPFADMTVTIRRHGFAGETVYVHARIEGQNTILTFRPNQLKLVR
jgi:hypothetical protein